MLHFINVNTGFSLSAVLDNLCIYFELLSHEYTEVCTTDNQKIVTSGTIHCDNYKSITVNATLKGCVLSVLPH